MESLSDYLKKMTSSSESRQKYNHIINEILQDNEVLAFITEHKDELTTDAVERNAANLYEFVLEKEKARKGKGQLMPGFNPQLIINNKQIEVTYVPSKDYLRQQSQAELKRRINSVHMPKDIKEATFAEFEQTHGRREALDRAVQFVEDFVREPDRFHKGLYLHGAFGVGKTYLLGAIAHELSTFGYASTLVHFPTFASEMRGSVADNTVTGKLNAYQSVEILMLDDIGAENNSSWMRDDVLGVILQYRMQNELPTLFSSNFDMKQIETEHFRYGSNGDDEILKAKRIMERIRFLADEVEVSGINRRNER
jgi:primosomal protein DnaI